LSAILITGANGQVGAELFPLLKPLGEVVATTRGTLDLADAGAIVTAVRTLRPATIVNAAAYTKVDAAETDRDAAFALNGTAPGVLAEEARRAGALLIHYSTDYVFDGKAQRPYAEDAAPAPLSVYGASKLEGERRIAASGARAIVFRTSWVYGMRGANFLLTMQRLARERSEIGVVDDQVGVPNWSRALARATARVLALGNDALADRAGLYHLSCTGQASWYEFAREILRDAPVNVRPIATTAYPTPARRPAYGVLDTTKFERSFGFALPDWRTALAECLGRPAVS
jgi:dTDP-4-dehydrorhamnose reductase